MTRQLILGTAGHIDHGKTSLVRALTGVDTDRLPQEKKRGITIDIGFADLAIGDTHYGIIDVPGHERFVKNMLAGAVGIDVALLVVAADDSVMPQTREHLAIMQMLGITRGVIALTKADMVEPSWIDIVTDDIRSLTAGTFLSTAQIVPTSATTGTGLDELRKALSKAGADTPCRTADGPFRLAIDRSFMLEGRGTIVTGTAWSGSVNVGDELDWLPSMKSVRVRGIQSHGQPVESASAGQRVAINLAGVHHQEIQRGDELATPGTLEPARRITVQLETLADAARPIRHRSRIRLHIGSSEMMASVRLFRGTEIAPGQSSLAHILCAQPIVSRCGQPFVVRNESPVTTLGGGVILQPAATRVSRRDASSIEHLTKLASEQRETRAAAAVYFRDQRGWAQADLQREANLDAMSARQITNELIQSHQFVQVASGPDSTVTLHRDHQDQLFARILKALDSLHAASPLEPFVPVTRLASDLSYIRPHLLGGLLHLLATQGEIKMNTDGVSRQSFEPLLSQRQLGLRTTVAAHLSEAAFRPPPIKELADQCSTTESELAPVLDLMISQGTLVNIGGGFMLHADRDSELRQRIGDLLTGSKEREGLSVSEIKDNLDTTRKYAVPICEYLDRVGVTRRVGNARKAGPHVNAAQTEPPKS